MLCGGGGREGGREEGEGCNVVMGEEGNELGEGCNVVMGERCNELWAM